MPEAQQAEEHAAVDRVSPWRRLSRLFRYARPYRLRFWLAIVVLLGTVAGGLAVPWFLGDLMGTAFDPQSGDLDALNETTLVLLVLVVVQGALVFVRHYFMSWVGERVVTDLRLELQRHLLRMPPSFFHANRTGELLSRQNDDATRLQAIIGETLSMALRNVLTLFGAIAIMVYVSPKLTGTMLLVVPPIVIVTTIWSRWLRKLSRKGQDLLATASGDMQEGIGAIDTVQSFTREDYEAGRYRNQIEAAFAVLIRRVRVRSTFMAVTSFLMFGAVVGIMWFGGRMALAGTISAAELSRVVIYTASVGGAVGALGSVFTSYNQAIGATARIFEILDSEPAIEDLPGARDLVDPKGHIEFDDVSFAYNDRDAPVIERLDLAIAPGEVCALVGSSGSGKTTIGRLLLRFWDPQSGSIRVDGQDVRELTLASLRGAMAEVSQDPVLFSGSIRENIRYGRLEATDAEVEAAAEAANAHGFILEFPEGYDTVVGERGVKLSGGQRQRVAIARAILRDPKILILDEATSALDSESEHMVQAALERLQRGRTTLVIAHRLSTIRDADRIVVLDHGRVVEQGTHEQLLARDGAYGKLVARQASFEPASVA